MHSEEESHKKITLRFHILLVVALILQIGCWWLARPIKPTLGIVPSVPPPHTVRALSFGDEQFYFRVLTFALQNAGDTFGRFTPLKEYDYHMLYNWFMLLDGLDATSNFVPAIASYYYSQTQHVPDVRYIVDYLEQHAARDPARKWWWLSQAVYLAHHKLKDKQRALTLAYALAKTPGTIPWWARQMPAFILESLGEREQAYLIIKEILDRADHIPQSELNFMRYFIRDRLKILQDSQDSLPKSR